MSRINKNPLDKNKANWINKDKKKGTSTTKKGLKKGLTRATFIIEDDVLDKLKDWAYTNRTTIKDEVNAALKEFLKGKEVIERPED